MTNKTFSQTVFCLRYVGELKTFEEILHYVCAKVQDHQNFPLSTTYGLTDGSEIDLAELKSGKSPKVLIHHRIF